MERRELIRKVKSLQREDELNGFPMKGKLDGIYHSGLHPLFSATSA
jgi:hypothetical protein